MALTDKLSAIGDAIRAKTGKSDLLSLDAMPAEIASIQTGGGSGSGNFVETIKSYEYEFTASGSKTSKSAVIDATVFNATTKILFADFGIKPDLSNLVSIVTEIGTYQIRWQNTNGTDYYYSNSYTFTPRIVKNDSGGLDVYQQWYKQELEYTGYNYLRIKSIDAEGIELAYTDTRYWTSDTRPVGFKYVYVITTEE